MAWPFNYCCCTARFQRLVLNEPGAGDLQNLNGSSLSKDTSSVKFSRRAVVFLREVANRQMPMITLLPERGNKHNIPLSVKLSICSFTSNQKCH